MNRSRNWSLCAPLAAFPKPSSLSRQEEIRSLSVWIMSAISNLSARPRPFPIFFENRQSVFKHIQPNPVVAQNRRASLRMKESCSPAERQLLRSGIRSRVLETRIGHICACNVLRLPLRLALHLEWRQWGAPCSPGSQESKKNEAYFKDALILTR